MPETLEIPVLFCSQTGNAFDAAEKLASLLSTKLSTPTLTITSAATTLDDFLEIELRTPPDARTPNSGLMPLLFCVVCSSYGVGQAPLGGYKFRELCDHLLSEQAPADVSALWKGCRYAMLGLGDSKYTTFFLNPLALDGGLARAGAERVGPLGKADVSTDTGTQADLIEQWSTDILAHLGEALRQRQAAGELDRDDTGIRRRMASDTVAICKDIFQDWDEDAQLAKDQKKGSLLAILVPLVPIGIVFMLVMLFFSPPVSDHEL